MKNEGFCASEDENKEFLLQIFNVYLTYHVQSFVNIIELEQCNCNKGVNIEPNELLDTGLSTYLMLDQTNRWITEDLKIMAITIIIK